MKTLLLIISLLLLVFSGIYGVLMYFAFTNGNNIVGLQHAIVCSISYLIHYLIDYNLKHH